MSQLDLRSQIVDFLRRELVGPDPVSPNVQANGEEILTMDAPRLRYGAGILFPRATITEIAVDTSPEEAATQPTNTEMEMPEGASIDAGSTSATGSLDEPAEAADETVSLTNAFLPSALGLSCLVDIPDTGLVIKVSAATYRTQSTDYMTKSGEKRVGRNYLREPFDAEVSVPSGELLGDTIRQYKTYLNRSNGAATSLQLRVLSRPYGSSEGDTPIRLLTVSLVNTNPSLGGRAESDRCFFQVGLEIHAGDCSACFREYPEHEGISLDDEEASLRLLYRHRKTYAIGHGCAANWTEISEGKASTIQADILPVYEIKPIVPARFNDISLKMLDFSDSGDESQVVPMLNNLCDRYEDWIDKQQAEVNTLEFPEEHLDAASNHLENCRACLKRMRVGVQLLKSDKIALHAFRLSNKAMLLQQLHYAMDLREWEGASKTKITISPAIWPDIDNPPEGKGSWYPFQMAFILINLQSLSQPEHPDRTLVDLIWFPTGGGKTEAYLGVTAFAILYRRLINPANGGTTVLMRYTLRLLTAQQFERAASLICSLEYMRQKTPAELGEIPISIGLWVGNEVTPGTREQALSKLTGLVNGTERSNPFVLLKCPWCGAQMGLITVKGHNPRIIGYERQQNPATVAFCCKDEHCFFSGNRRLPLIVIDQDIYATPPTLLIGTIDKFATLPWKPDARKLFGIDMLNISPPDLIIQDELHLISGPLGSMVGHYETVIQELCSQRKGNATVGPKIVASTATISRAAEQCHALYNCGNEGVFQFPPQCLRAGDSFFAREDEQATGRMYIGVHASALPSHVTAQVRVMSALLQAPLSAAVDSEAKRDPYWTLISYFNSLRELGHAATLIRADIREYLNAMWLRKGIKKPENSEPDCRRFINSSLELTSRVSSSTIPESLQKLGREFSANREEKPVDICLASNMISVGVDVPRLGLMSVVGQPKTTSEYIQATSRVGRGRSVPGLVVVVYNTGKPRDRSHYEHFRSYHASIYRYVEPTSVTPFAAPVRERALHALAVTLVRFMGAEENRTRPTPFPASGLMNYITDVIYKRVSQVDSAEADGTMERLQEFIEQWQGVLPPRYGDFGRIDASLPLMYPAGTETSAFWEDKSWPTPSSMRDVDATCEASIIKRYI